jgi:signal transduction histidine kinase
VRDQGVPITLNGRPGHGVIVAACFVTRERQAATRAAGLMPARGGHRATGRHRGLGDRRTDPATGTGLASTARAITETDLSARIPTSATAESQDEIGELVHVVNSMLDRIEVGVRAQRRFIDDASYELRTPVTIIRGHLDVVDLDDRADLQATHELVDDELGRMNRIVTDMLVLAKLDHPEFVHPEPTEMRSLMNRNAGQSRSARATAVVAVPARDATPTEVLEEPTLEALVDAQRIIQALSCWPATPSATPAATTVSTSDSDSHHTAASCGFACPLPASESRLPVGHACSNASPEANTNPAPPAERAWA